MLTTQAPPADVLIPATDGTALRGWFWTRSQPRAVLVISHGFGEHGGCYRHVAEAIGPLLEVDVLALDYRGHGRSPGRRGVLQSFEDLAVDLHSALDWAARARPNLQRFLLGHSNGGLVALHVALSRRGDLSGLVLSNPALALGDPPPRYKVAIGHVLRRFAPRVTLSAPVAAERMTRDPAMQREHRTDPLRHCRISAPLFFGMLEEGAAVGARAGEIQVPTLIVLGTSDRVIDPEATRRFYENLGSTDKTLLIYPKMLHEPLNEIGREQVFADITAWLNERIETPSE